jgi:hypothetical protein
MSPKRRASPAEVRLALVVVLTGSGGAMFFGLAESLHWLSPLVAIAGIVASVGFIVVCGLLANRRQRR